MIKQDNFLFFTLREKFTKTQQRLEKAIATGRFASMSHTKKRELFQRLNRYAKQIGARLKPGIAAAFIAAGLFMASGASAQTFSEITGASNPLNGKTVSDSYSKPCFVDIDNDGDKDLFAGRSYYDEMRFYNTGTASAAVFGSGTLPHSAGIFNAAPAFFDIDNDGDQDMFMGRDNGTIMLYPNTGSAAVAAFPTYPLELSALSGYANPLTAVSVGGNATPVFVDIDNDGDKDCFIGNSAGTIAYYKNTGTLALPVFTLQAGAANPFNGVDVGSNSAPAFADIDKDGDMDAVIGNAAGTLLYYKNTGTAGAPAFTAQAGAANPFNGISIVLGQSAPAFVDIDNDGDQDLFSGRFDGGFQFFRNTTPALPIHWQSFSAQKLIHQQVLLNWSTAAEINSGDFVIEHSTDGSNWTAMGTVQAKGNTSTLQQYSFTDPAAGSINYYRILQRDLDGRSSYSEVRTVRFSDNESSFTILTGTVSSGVLQVQLNNSSNLNLYNSSGQLLLQKKFAAGNQQIDMTPYPKGVYYLKGTDHTERFIW